MLVPYRWATFIGCLWRYLRCGAGGESWEWFVSFEIEYNFVSYQVGVQWSVEITTRAAIARIPLSISGGTVSYKMSNINVSSFHVW